MTSVNPSYTSVAHFPPLPTSAHWLWPQIASELTLPSGQNRPTNDHSSGQPELVQQAGILSEEMRVSSCHW